MKESNKEQELAQQFIEETDTSIFLTGKAGTGKTTFLKTLLKDRPKRLIVTAPTGVAAINAHGVTLHSFFQLSFGPYLPGREQEASFSYRFSKEKTSIIKGLDLLIIDEISMVRGDLLDNVDAVLRRIRRKALPFGGVQLLLIGDLHQLPPVVKNEEWALLRQYYNSPYFFESKALSEIPYITIELQHIYRQNDARFIEILNEIRDNRVSESSLTLLNNQVTPGLPPSAEEGIITLCTHNANADAINTQCLDALPSKVFRFEADVTGDFPDHAHPTASSLELKVGAQVMFLKNDTENPKRFYNGKIGCITKIAEQIITVDCGGLEDIDVAPSTWENIRYHMNDDSLEIEEERIGSFKQYPLRLAWAITIHKSQGLTFDKAYIDVQSSFAHGQIYVALSRCKSLAGMMLTAPFPTGKLAMDQAVLSFLKKSKREISEDDIQQARLRYQQRLILECFDFTQFRTQLRHLMVLCQRNGVLVNLPSSFPLNRLVEEAEETIFKVGPKFQNQLTRLFSETCLPAADPLILDRLNKASHYFNEKFTAIFADHLDHLQIETDNKEIQKRAQKALGTIKEEYRCKKCTLKECEHGFSPTAYLRALLAATVEEPKKKQKTVYSVAEEQLVNQEFFTTLKNWRAKRAEQDGLAHFQVMHQKTLVQIAASLPRSMTDLLKISGIGKKTAGKYGNELLALIESQFPAPENETVTEKPGKNS